MSQYGIDKRGLTDVFPGVLSPEDAASEKASLFDKLGGFVDEVGDLAGRLKRTGLFSDHPLQTSTDASGQTVAYEAGKPAPVAAKPSGWNELLGSFARVLEQGATQAGQVIAAREINKDLNDNPPWNVYAVAGFGLLALYIILNRKG